MPRRGLDGVPQRSHPHDGLQRLIRRDRPFYFHVQPRQTITAIADQADMDWRDLAEANGIDNPLEDIFAGMELVIY